MNFTRREKHVAVVFTLSILLMLLFGKRLPDNEIYEYVWLIFFVVPLGIYIATDPERRKVD